MGIHLSLRGLLLLGLLLIGLYAVATCKLLDCADGFRSAQANRMNRTEMVLNK